MSAIKISLSNLTITCEYDQEANNLFVDYEKVTNDFYLADTKNNFVEVVKKDSPPALELELSHVPSHKTNLLSTIGLLSSWKSIINRENCEKTLKLITAVILGQISLSSTISTIKTRQIVVRPSVKILK